MATPTAQDIIRPWQPGAFSSGLRAGLAFRQQRESEKQRELVQKKSDATKRALQETLTLLSNENGIPLPQAINAGLKNNPDAVPEVLVNTLQDLMPQMTPYQKALGEETKRYHDAIIGRYDEDREERKRQFDINDQRKKDESFRETMKLIDESWQDADSQAWLKKAKEHSDKTGAGLRESLGATYPTSMKPDAIKRITGALEPILETRQGSQARPVNVVELRKLKAKLLDSMSTASGETRESLRQEVAEVQKAIDKAEGNNAETKAEPKEGGGSFEELLLKEFQDWKKARQ